ncbi:MAG: hypothetical protein JXP34_03350 [Planctomycetes bacterium]|nr:hypothetical protein [Planctomycetota bacterium]
MEGMWSLAPVLLVALAGSDSPRAADPVLEDAVRALGDPDWRRREEAEQAILAAGEAAIPALERAAGAGDREIALRARAILDRLDPEEATFRILRLEAVPAGADGGEGRVLPFRAQGCAILRGRDGAVRGAEVARDGARPSSFTVTYRAGGDGLLWVDVEETAPGATIPLLAGPIRRDAIRILKRACLSVAGPLVHGARAEEHTFTWTLESRSGRRSHVRRSPWPLPGSGQVIDAVAAAVAAQRAAEDPILRDEAEELVRFLGLEDAALDRAHLKETLADGSPALPEARIRAALALAGAGDPAGPRFLARTLPALHGFQHHLALRSIERAIGDVQVRSALEDLMIGSGSGRAPWDDPIWERIALAWTRARGATASLASLAALLAEPAGRGEDARTAGIVRVATVLLDEAEVGPPVVDRLLGAAPALLEGATLRDTVDLLTALPTGRASDEAIRRFFEALEEPVGKGALSASAAAQAARAVIARIPPERSDRLRAAVEILIRHARTPHGVRAVAALLEAITGAALPTTGRPSPERARAAEGRWRAWLADPEAAHRYLASEDAAMFTAEVFDLWVPGGGGPELLGAARIRVAAGRPSIARTSAGRSVLISLASVSAAGGSRIVLHDVYGQSALAEGRIVLLPSIAAGSVRYDEISDRSPVPVPRFPSKPAAVRVAIRLLEAEPAGPFDAAAAWPSAIADLVRALPDLTETERTRALAVVTSLGVREAEDGLAEILERTKERAYAYALAEIGSRRASAFLRAEIRSGADDRRVRAAQALAACGDPAGLDALIEAIATVSPTQRGVAAFAIGRAFESGALGPERQAAAIRVLIERLDARNASSILPVLRRIAGLSFDAGDAIGEPAASIQGREREIRAWKEWGATQGQAR